MTPRRASFTARPWPAERFVDAGEVDELRRSVPLLDARPFGRFTGDEPSVDAVPGHIPGARSAPWAENVDPETGPLPARPTSCGGATRRSASRTGRARSRSCGSGVTACHDLLALRIAGFAPGALYPGSWSGWSSDADRPVALGSE